MKTISDNLGCPCLISCKFWKAALRLLWRRRNCPGLAASAWQPASCRPPLWMWDLQSQHPQSCRLIPGNESLNTYVPLVMLLWSNPDWYTINLGCLEGSELTVPPPIFMRRCQIPQLSSFLLREECIGILFLLPVVQSAKYLFLTWACLIYVNPLV